MKKILMSIMLMGAVIAGSAEAAPKTAKATPEAICGALSRNIVYVTRETSTPNNYDKKTMTQLKKTLDKAYAAYYNNGCKESALSDAFKGEGLAAKPRGRADAAGKPTADKAKAPAQEKQKNTFNKKPSKKTNNNE